MNRCFTMTQFDGTIIHSTATRSNNRKSVQIFVSSFVVFVVSVEMNCRFSSLVPCLVELTTIARIHIAKTDFPSNSQHHVCNSFALSSILFLSLSVYSINHSINNSVCVTLVWNCFVLVWFFFLHCFLYIIYKHKMPISYANHKQWSAEARRMSVATMATASERTMEWVKKNGESIKRGAKWNEIACLFDWLSHFFFCCWHINM